MLKKIIKFLDKHRLILIILILFLVSFMFLGIKSYIFLNNNFKAFKCTKEIDDTYCYYNDIKIYNNPQKMKEKIIDDYKEEIGLLKDKYMLPELDNYTSYFYQVASLLEYNMTLENEELYNFFWVYNNTYNLEKFYIKNTFFYHWFYNYKLPINID